MKKAVAITLLAAFIVGSIGHMVKSKPILEILPQQYRLISEVAAGALIGLAAFYIFD